MDAAQNLSNNISALRNIRSLTITDFAKEIGISKSTLQEIEKGHSPNLNTVECIARSLGIPVSVLISDTLPPTEMSALVQLFQHISWYATWSQEDQSALLELLCQISRLFAKYAV